MPIYVTRTSEMKIVPNLAITDPSVFVNAFKLFIEAHDNAKDIIIHCQISENVAHINSMEIKMIARSNFCIQKENEKPITPDWHGSLQICSKCKAELPSNMFKSGHYACLQCEDAQRREDIRIGAGG